MKTKIIEKLREYSYFIWLILLIFIAVFVLLGGEAIAQKSPKSKFYDFNEQVIDGEIKNKSKARIVRDGNVIYEGEIQSIFREKNAVKEVKNGLECGISLKDFMDFKERDIIESFIVEKIERSI